MEQQKNKFFIGFADKIIHEIKNPLHNIYNIGLMINKNYQKIDQDDLKHMSNILLESTKNIDEILNHISDLENNLSQMNYQFDNIKFVHYIKNIIDDLSYSKCNIQMKFQHFTDDECEKFTVKIDKFWIKRIFYNIIGNSFKHSQNENLLINLIISKEPDSVKIIINDNGGGSADKTLNAKQNRLGLRLCQEVIEAHSGKFSISDSDNGLKIIMKLPI